MGIWKNCLCIFEKICNWVVILTTCCYRQSCTLFRYWSQQRGTLWLLLDHSCSSDLQVANKLKKRNIRVAWECHQEQPWEQLSLERKSAVKAVLFLVGIYISSQKSRRILACVGCLQAGESRMGTCSSKQILNSQKISLWNGKLRAVHCY